MPERVLIVGSALEFFRTALIEAMTHCRVTTGAFTEYYLVNLLVNRLRYEHHPDTPLAHLYCRAMLAPPAERARVLRELGDSALAVCGLWPQSVSGPRQVMNNESYYMTMGRRAYTTLSTMGVSTFGTDVFAELAGRFIEFADVFLQVSASHDLSSMRGTLALYERWARTGSPAAARLLAERGIFPGDPVVWFKH